MIARGIREFVSRDWDAVRESKVAYWGQRIARLGSLEAMRMAEELRQHVLAHDPSWPDAESRRDDLDSHIRLTERLRRAAAVCRR